MTDTYKLFTPGTILFSDYKIIRLFYSFDYSGAPTPSESYVDFQLFSIEEDPHTNEYRNIRMEGSNLRRTAGQLEDLPACCCPDQDSNPRGEVLKGYKSMT